MDQHQQPFNSNKEKTFKDSILKENDDESQLNEKDHNKNLQFKDIQASCSNHRESTNLSISELNIQEKTNQFKTSPSFIPLLIVELALSLVDLLSDLWTGTSLLKLKEKAWAGAVSFVINWIPGVIGATQIIANRRFYGIAWTILYCSASILFCPIVPTITFAYLLCKVPRDSEEEKSKDFVKSFQKLLSFTMIVRALEGCIESPLQLLYKTFLMFNGVIDFNFTSPDYAIQDLHGNDIPAVYESNNTFVIEIKIKITPCYCNKTCNKQ